MDHPSDAFVPLLTVVASGAELDPAEIRAAVEALTDPGQPEADKAAFLRALRERGETAAEIAGFAAALLERAVDPEIDPARLPGPAIDICGTGGDRLHLFNVSTTVCFILAAGGAAVIKHGNRAVTSRSGGSDVLTALGVPLDATPAQLRRDLEWGGLAFLAAPRFHPAFAAIAPVRRQLAAEGVGTIFNLLGPLLNPAGPAHQLVGVFTPALTGTFAEVLRRLGRREVWAVHGAGGMDEMSTLGETSVSRFGPGTEITYDTVRPEGAGLARIDDLGPVRGGSPEENACTLIGLLDGEIRDARLDLVLLNAAAGFVVAGLSKDLGAGVERARAAIASGRPKRILDRMRGGS